MKKVIVKSTFSKREVLSISSSLFWQKIRIGPENVTRNKALYWLTWCLTILSLLRTLAQNLLKRFSKYCAWVFSTMTKLHYIKSANISTLTHGPYSEFILFSIKTTKIIIKTTKLFLLACTQAIVQCWSDILFWNELGDPKGQENINWSTGRHFTAATEFNNSYTDIKCCFLALCFVIINVNCYNFF